MSTHISTIEPPAQRRTIATLFTTATCCLSAQSCVCTDAWLGNEIRGAAIGRTNLLERKELLMRTLFAVLCVASFFGCDVPGSALRALECQQDESGYLITGQVDRADGESVDQANLVIELLRNGAEISLHGTMTTTVDPAGRYEMFVPTGLTRQCGLDGFTLVDLAGPPLGEPPDTVRLTLIDRSEESTVDVDVEPEVLSDVGTTMGTITLPLVSFDVN